MYAGTDTPVESTSARGEGRKESEAPRWGAEVPEMEAKGPGRAAERQEGCGDERDEAKTSEGREATGPLTGKNAAMACGLSAASSGDEASEGEPKEKRQASQRKQKESRREKKTLLTHNDQPQLLDITPHDHGRPGTRITGTTRPFRIHIEHWVR